MDAQRAQLTVPAEILAVPENVLTELWADARLVVRTASRRYLSRLRSAVQNPRSDTGDRARSSCLCRGYYFSSHQRVPKKTQKAEVELH